MIVLIIRIETIYEVYTYILIYFYIYILTYVYTYIDWGGEIGHLLRVWDR